MIKKIGIQCVIIVVLIFALHSVGFSSGIDWSGRYRVEFNQLQSAKLTSDSPLKEYINHHLVLKPKIIASDGLTIFGRFDILNSSSRNQLGGFLGDGLTGAGTHFNDSQATSNTLDAHMINVSQLYLTLTNEYGAFIAGRTPFHFGLGMVLSAGEGEFDHFYNTRDMVGYKIVFGNYYILPSMAKIKEGDIGQSLEDVTEYNLHIQLDNPDTDTSLGLLYSMRRSSLLGNDTPVTLPGFVTKTEGVDYNLLDVYWTKKMNQHQIAVEVAMYDGDYGVDDIGGRKIKARGTGLAFEYEYQPSNKKHTYGIKAGMAKGDDLSSTESYEGFSFNRNYDVAVILFNHRLGQADFLQTNMIGGGGATTQADTEAISNVTYFAPYFNYQWKEKWGVKTSLITAQISETIGNGDSNLGLELDIALTYKPHDGFKWVTELGYLMTGSAFEGGLNGFATDSSMALVSKVAISF